ncbi:capsular exopolysaccharide synthesis family protein [Sphaerotilus hippei]|uniref:non-specific protein-tyrosine kinase n=1 Tax=Sphaerotilus hippei TaxID=744406 RepID=A0A318GVS2_9BURK|nr:polysaccharide biosynthesis tyrosine autokinase [Sphaerotilus hippei]PXW93255.1 capsular exopolysaccharide synthesis family protein [Sphaerotilus hippei]
MNQIQVVNPQQGPLAMPGQPMPFAPVQLGLSDESKLALLDYWRSIKARKWPILGLATMMALLAAAVAFSMTPIYKSTATVLIEQGKGKVLSFDDMFAGAAQTKEHYQTQVEILKSRDVALKTVTAMKLWNQPEFDPRKGGDGIGKKMLALVGVKEAQPEWTDDKLASATVGAVMNNLSVEPVRLSQLVKVSFESPDRNLAQRVSNELAARYIDADREAKFKQAQALNGWLDQRATELRTKLAESEDLLQKYREDQGLVSLEGSAQALAGRRIADVSTRLADARARRMTLDSAYQGISSIKNGDYSNVPAVVSSMGVQGALQREAEAVRNLAQLTETLGSSHPNVLVAKSAVDEARSYKRAQIQAVVKSVLEEYGNARRAEGALMAELETASGSVQDVNRKEFKLAVLERDVSSNKQLYEMFMIRAKELSSGSDLQSAIARVVDPAVAANVPVKPNKAQIILVAFMLGLLLGSGGALAMERLDNTIKGGESTELKLHQPVLTVLPAVTEEDAPKVGRLFVEAPSSHHAEAMRTARTGLLLSNIDTRHRVVLVTSSLPTEGKTSTSTNLALALAQTKRTLLIDADMRKPQVGTRLGLPANAKGLSNLVAGTATLKECVHQVEGSTLMVIPAGDVPPNPLELLLSQRFKEVIEHLKPQLDFILIDSPPVELVSDAMSIAPMASETVFVVKANQSTYTMARKSLNRLQRAGTHIQGVVVNGLDFDKAQRYYGSEYGQNTYAAYGGTYGSYGTSYDGGAKPATAVQPAPTT